MLRDATFCSSTDGIHGCLTVLVYSQKLTLTTCDDSLRKYAKKLAQASFLILKLLWNFEAIRETLIKLYPALRLLQEINQTWFTSIFSKGKTAKETVGIRWVPWLKSIPDGWCSWLHKVLFLCDKNSLADCTVLYFTASNWWSYLSRRPTSSWITWWWRASSGWGWSWPCPLSKDVHKNLNSYSDVVNIFRRKWSRL